MRTSKDLTPESFDRLLAWLDADRDQAARKYEQIRKTLIQIFTWRNFSAAEELADETIDRVAARVDEIAPAYLGNPSKYFYGVAKLLMREQARTQKLQASLEARLPYLAVAEVREGINVERECLSKCLDELSPRTRELVVKYYTKEKQRKIEYRKDLAARLGITGNSLRVRLHRIRADLENCVEKCVNAHGTSE